MRDPEEYQETFEKLQQLEQGKMQRLGDELLPGIFPSLIGLKSQGLNLEGKTRKGVPDSFVGKTPETARAAVEYTTQLKDLDQKLLKDFSGVRKSCPAASTIVLCTNRSTEGLDLAGLLDEAQKASVNLEIVDGRRLAELLCTHRQDLRKAFLGISIGAHTITSLIHAMREHLVTMVQGRTTAGTLERFIPRTGLDPLIVQRAKRGAGFMLLRASAGMGKTTWSVEHAYRHSFVEPVAWMTATDLMSQSADPISEQVVMAAYGAPDPGRIPELADLLRREGRLVRVFIDAIDEANDYGQFGRQLRVFRGSVLAKSTLVILLCREQAARLLQEALEGILPELRTQDATLTLRELNQEDSQLLLRKLGADAKEIRELHAHLPTRYAGNPLFLVHALRLHQAGELESAGEDLIPAISEHFVKDIRDRLKKSGSAPSLPRIRSVLGGLALRALENGRDALHPGEIEALSGAQEEGENTLLSRAEQTGLLVQTGDGRIGFSHPLFFEYFAALAISGKSAELQQELLSRGGSGREVLHRIIGSVQDPLPLLRFMLERDPVGACEAATRLKVISDEAVSERLLEIIRGLLSSRFPSDVTRGLLLLGKLSVPAGRKLAVDWFNGLSAENRQRWMMEAAELFLSLKEDGAAGVILYHRSFRFPDDFPWYEPAFVQRVRALPGRMKAVLSHRARQQLVSASDEGLRARLVHVLATLGDVRLIAYLRKRVAAGPLTKGEHRALILLNTREAILLYAESADMCLRQEEQTQEPPGSPQDDASEMSWWYRCVLKQEDIVMYPHDQLVELVACALESEDTRNMQFGSDWADTLQSPELIERYSSATHRTRGFLGRMVEKLLEAMPFERVVGSPGTELEFAL